MIIAHCLMGDINLSDAETRTTDFHGSSINNLNGEGLSVNGDFLVNGGLTAAGSLDLTDAKIDGDLRCNGAYFKKPPNRSRLRWHKSNAMPTSIKLIRWGRLDLIEVRSMATSILTTPASSEPKVPTVRDLRGSQPPHNHKLPSSR
jgi:hypothetical protein